MPQIIGVILLITLYLLYLMLAWFAAKYLVLVGAAGFIGVAMWNHAREMWRGLVGGKGFEDEPVGDEPAYKHYFFHQAYRDYELILRRSWEENLALGKRMVDLAASCFREEKAILTWPLGLMCFIGLLAGAIGAGLLFLLSGLIYAAAIALSAVVTIVLAWMLRLVEYLRMAYGRIFLACPNADCYRKIAIPVYQCPDCGSEHNRLIPGTYGLLRRRCQCETSLATMFLLGRNQLPGYCPHCRRPLSETIGIVRNLHIPIVGGPAAGKTSFLMANMSDLYELDRNGEIALEFPERKDQTLFERCARDFAGGVAVDKTTALSPDAFLVNLGDRAGNQGLLYVYDAAGELYQQMDSLRPHEYYGYTHGILFLLDPFSLPAVKVDFQSELSRAASQVKPCAEEPQAVYDRMIATFRQHPRMKNGLGRIPFAVVLTKADAFGLEKRIQATPAPPPPPPSRLAAMRDAVSRKTESRESTVARQWLLDHGGGNLVRGAEQDFQNVRYFHCSALGRLPDGSPAPFTPRNAIEPLAWLLDRHHLRIGETSSGGVRAKSIPMRGKVFSTSPSVSAPPRIHNQAIVLALWIAGLLGSAWWGAGQFSFSGSLVPDWLSSSRLASESGRHSQHNNHPTNCQGKAHNRDFAKALEAARAIIGKSRELK